MQYTHTHIHIKCHYPSFYKSLKSKYIAEMSVAHKYVQRRERKTEERERERERSRNTKMSA